MFKYVFWFLLFFNGGFLTGGTTAPFAPPLATAMRVRVNRSTNRMVHAESRFAEDHSCNQWKQTDYLFADIEISSK